MVALIVAVLMPLVGIGGDIELQLRNFRQDMMKKPATGEIIVVEIDAKSIGALKKWPWPRQNYAKLIDKLSASGAAQIAFDVDFSSQSINEQDQIFADAIKRSEASIILPTFKQKEAFTQSAFVESFPIDILREHAFLGSVNVTPDLKGQVNHYAYGTITNNTARPSLASMVAEKSGNVEGSFLIDQSIDPATIPRYSFYDILQMDDQNAAFQGKNFIVGATAIELGDRYPISGYGIIPGVIVQAMAAETLLQGANMINIGFVPPLLCVAVLFLILALRSRRNQPTTIIFALVAVAALFISLSTSEYLGLYTFSNVPALFFLLMYVLVEKFVNTGFALKKSIFWNANSQLPNEAAFAEFVENRQNTNIAVARLNDFRELLILTDKERQIALFKNLAERLKFLADDDRIFHLDTDTVAWIVKEDYESDISSHFESAIALFHAPFMAGDTKVKLSATFGISVHSIDNAKIAADQAYRTDKRWVWHDEGITNDVGVRQNMLIELEQAIDNDDIWTVYQPKWDMVNNRINGAEALVRWKHPENGMISPEFFIPVLEKAGRIDKLTLHVLRRTLLDFVKWDRLKTGLSCSINVSAKLLRDSKFIEQIIAEVENSAVNNNQIIFEVTETAALADIDLSILALNRIRDAGIKVSVDDYGTGQSTMSYLQRLPIDEIKIDQSFIKTMVSDASNSLLVKSTIELAHGLKLKVVAEGIEDAKIMAQLEAFGCDVGQGWHIGKPASSEDFINNWLSPENGRKQVFAAP